MGPLGRGGKKSLRGIQHSAGTWQEGFALRVLHLRFVSPTERQTPACVPTHRSHLVTQPVATFSLYRDDYRVFEYLKILFP